MPFFTRPHFEDRQIVQYNDESIQLSGKTKVGPTLLDFTGTTTAQTTVTIMGVTGYLNEGREYGLQVQPPLLKISGSTGYTTTDVTGYVLKAVDAFGNVGWDTVSVSADTNTFVTGGTLNGSNQLILSWNTGGSASAIDLSSLSDSTYWTAGTSGTGSIRVVNDGLGTTDATGNHAVAEGLNTTASGTYSHSEGYETTASGDYGSHAEGYLTIANGTSSHAEGDSTTASGYRSHAEGGTTVASGNDSHAGGRLTTASGNRSHAGGDGSIVSGDDSFIHSKDSFINKNNAAILGGTNNQLSADADRSVVLGGTGITGLTSNTTYVPNLTVRENHILHSDSTLEVVDIPGSFESSIKGSYTEFNWDGITTNLLTNSNPSGYTAFLLGNFAPYPTVLNHGFLSYYGTGYTRTGAPQTGVNFYRNKMVLKTAADSEGTVFSNANPSGLWVWESDGNSRMKLTKSGFLGLGLDTNGIENPSEMLHVKGGDILVTNTNGQFYTDIQNSAGPLTLLSGATTELSRFGVSTPTYDSVVFGIRGGSEPSFPGYGKQGDAFIYSSAENNGFNIVSQPGTGTDDYVRFFVGQTVGAAGTPDLYIQGNGSTRGNVGINNDSPTEKLHVSGNTLISGELTVQTINTGTTVYLLGANSSGTVIQANDIYSDICAFCSSNVSGDTIVGSGTTETESVNSEGNTVDSTSPYSCTQWCAYGTGGELVATTTDYETAEKYKLSGLIVRCCDGNSGDGGTDYGTSISGETTTPGGGPPTVITGLTRPFTVRNARKVSLLNTHKSDVLNSNQVSISDSTLGRIELSTLSSIETSFNSEIYNSNLSNISSSENGFITNSSNASIIGSQYSVLSGVTGSTIIGGNNITGTDNDTVYVPKLNIDTLGGGTSVNNLGIDVNGNVVVGTAGGGIPEATTATTTTIGFTGQTIYYDSVTPGTGNISEDLTGAKLGLIQKIYHNDATEPTYPGGWVLMGDAIYFTSQLNIIYAEWAGGTRVEYWYVQEQ